MNVAVIGSGVAGLTAGAALAQAGHRVTVYEQFSRPGGVTAPYERDGFKWDLGQLLIEGLGADEPSGAILAALGVLDQIKVVKDDRGYVFPDFEIRKPQEFGGIRWRIERLKEIFPEEADGIERYWKDYLRFMRLMTAARRSENSQGMQALTRKARLYTSLLPFLTRKDWSAQRLMDDYFKSDSLKLVFMSILADFVTSPSQFIGLGLFMLNAEPTFEKRMPKFLKKDVEQLYHYSILGGISTLVDALVAKIVHYGGQICTNCTVTHIHVENNQVKGVTEKDQGLTPYDVVLASGGAKETFLKLVGEEHLPANFIAVVREQPLMESVFMLHLGIDFNPFPAVHGVCTYYYGTYDLDGALDEIRNGIYHEGKHGFVVHVPSLHSPDMAPAGHHAMTIYTICPDRLSSSSWQEMKEIYAERLLEYAEKYIPGLCSHVRVLEILTPDEFRLRTHLDQHAFGGIAPVMGAPRVPHKTPIEGLWFIGAQSESGGGVNNVILPHIKPPDGPPDWD